MSQVHNLWHRIHSQLQHGQLRGQWWVRPGNSQLWLSGDGIHLQEHTGQQLLLKSVICSQLRLRWNPWLKTYLYCHHALLFSAMLSKISGYNAIRNTKLSPKANGDPRSNMQIPKPKSQIPNPNLNPNPSNPKPISGYNATRNTKLSQNFNGDPRSNMQIPKPKSRTQTLKPLAGIL